MVGMIWLEDSNTDLKIISKRYAGAFMFHILELIIQHAEHYV
jgi:hypothetical protein